LSGKALVDYVKAVNARREDQGHGRTLVHFLWLNVNNHFLWDTLGDVSLSE
jgi:hypothetical protein